MKAGREIRRLVMRRLITQVPELAGRVYDRATETDIFPYVTLGPSYWSSDDPDCIEGRSFSLQVDVWCASSEGLGKGNAEDVVDDVAAALKGWSEGGALIMHPIEISLVRVMDDPSGAVHGVVQIDIDIEV